VLALLHGQASLSEEYERLRKQGREYMKLTSVGGEDAEPAVIAGDWFALPKRGLLTSYGVGTVDQILLSVLGSRHFFVRIFGLWSKVLIIDEVHAFDTYMTGLLERLLIWAARIGTPVLLLSATLPKGKREALATAYSKGLGGKLLQLDSCNYPRMTIVDSHTNTAVPTVPRAAAKTVGLVKIDRGELLHRLGERLKDGGNIAIVCNTVESARGLYLEIQNTFAHEVDLLHSRFLFKDRQERVNRVLTQVSRGKLRPYRSILVSTQIIEQSLDVDFDLLVTELPPIDLLLQRMGRLHRHERSPHPSFKSPEVWILQPELKDQTPVFGASAWVYDEHILLRTWLLLKEKEKVEIPEEIDSLIEMVYGDAEVLRLRASKLADFWLKTLRSMEKRICGEEDKAKRSHIRMPDRDVFDLVQQVEDPERALSRTRLFRPSVSLIVLYRQENGDLSFDIAGTDVINSSHRPSLSDTKRLIENSVSLPLRGNEISGKWLKLSTLPSAWQDRTALSGTHLLVIDRSGIGEVGPLKLVLDQSLGLCRADTNYSSRKM
jgi:CRISPR-associated endonuclease/helicase Cas3